MNICKKFFLIIALFAIHNAHCIDMLPGAPVANVQGANYSRFNQQYQGYLISQYGQVDPNWVRGAMAALQQDRLYSSNDFFNVLWGNIEQLVLYYAQGNQASYNAMRQSFENVFRQVAGSHMSQAQPAPQSVQVPTVKFTLRSLLDGVLGSAYASKVNEIYRYDYTQYATKRGDASLVYVLEKAIENANANPYPQQRIEELKNAIDAIYTELGAYRMRDQGSVNKPSNVRPLPPTPSAPQGYQPRSSVEANLNNFIAKSKSQGMTYNNITDAWFTEAAGVILGKAPYTKTKKKFVNQQIDKVVNAVIAEPLMNDQSITDQRYAEISQQVNDKIDNFMNKLQEGRVYGS